MTLRLSMRARGPLVLERGDEPIELLREDGSAVDISQMRKIRLCRCGASAAKPLCDGAHDRTGFEAPEPPADAEPDPR